MSSARSLNWLPIEALSDDATIMSRHEFSWASEILRCGAHSPVLCTIVQTCKFCQILVEGFDVPLGLIVHVDSILSVDDAQGDKHATHE